MTSTREALAGVGIGLLVGLLVALSTADVVGSVVAALMALLSAFLGLRGSSSEEPETTSMASGGSRSWRLAGFGIAGSLALVLGLWIRATNALGSSPQALMAEFVDAGFDSTYAAELVAYRVVGVLPEGRQLAEAGTVRNERVSVLFGARASDCSSLSEGRFDRPAAWANAFGDAEGAAWSRIGTAVKSLDPEMQRTILAAAWSLACED